MKNNRKVLYGLVALALLLSVVGISIGFAAMSQELEINGVAEVAPATWKIKFKDITTPTTTGDAVVTSEPNLASDTHINNYDFQLTKPGDSVTFTFKVANEGTIDAELGTYTKAAPTFTGTGTTAAADQDIVYNNFIYTLTYADGTAIGVGDTLPKNSSKSLKLTVAYPSTAEALPENQVNITGMDVTFVYSQD